MEYANDPFWKGLRWFLFVSFWLIWVAMLVVSIVIIIMAPKCPPPAPKQWWQKAPIYEVNVKNFKDSNGDGVGDIKGVTSKVDYLISLGVGSVWMSSPHKSGGPGSGRKSIAEENADHKEIDANLGTMDDFKELVAALHDNDIKMIMDFIPEHFDESSPVNWKNAEIKTGLKDTMKFWLDLGVDGFHIDAQSLDPKYPEVLELLKEFRVILDTKTAEDTYNPRIMITEAGGNAADYYGNYAKIVDQIGPISHIPLSLDMVEKLTANMLSPEVVKKTIEDYVSTLPMENRTKIALGKYDALSDEEKKTESDPRNWPLGKAWPNYCTGHEGYPRASTRFGDKLLDAMNMIIMMLQGSTVTYFGDEIGMGDAQSMMWTESGMVHEKPGHLRVYQEITKLRVSDSILYGDTKFFVNKSVLAYTRVKKGNPGYLVIANFGKENATNDFTGMDLMPGTGTVQIRDSANSGTERSLPLDKLSLGPEEGMVIAFVPDFGKTKETLEEEVDEVVE
jgi:glycosidase